MGNKQTYSPSSINMIFGCGQQYYYRYIEGRKIPPAARMIVGRAVDQSSNIDLQEKLDGKELLPVEAVIDKARDTVIAEWDKEGVALDSEEAEKGIEAVKGEAIDSSVTLARLHHTDVAPAIEPSALQRKFELTIAGYDFSIIGYKDIEERGGASIRDTKTSRKSPSRLAVDESTQLDVYALHSYAAQGIEPEVHLDYLVDLKTPKAVTISGRKTKADFPPVLERIAATDRAVKAGVFVPARADDWRCSERWCGYWNLCPYSRRPIQIATEGK